MDLDRLQECLAMANARCQADLAVVLLHARLAEFGFTMRASGNASLPAAWNKTDGQYHLEYLSPEDIRVDLDAHLTERTLRVTFVAVDAREAHAAFDVALDELTSADPTVLASASRAYTMHSHAVVKALDVALAALGNQWVKAHGGRAPAPARAATGGGSGGTASLAAPRYGGGDDEEYWRGGVPSPCGGRGSSGGDAGGFSIGHTDLDPLGRGAGSAVGSMLVGPGHPLFRGRFAPPSSSSQPPYGSGGFAGPFGGSGQFPMGIPRGSVPPGARFDPIHGVPPAPTNPFANPRGPDNDAFMPPHAHWGSDF